MPKSKRSLKRRKSFAKKFPGKSSEKKMRTIRKEMMAQMKAMLQQQENVKMFNALQENADEIRKQILKDEEE